MPAILLKCGDQWPVADILRFPERDRKGKRWNQVEQLDDSVHGCEIGRIRGEAGGFFLDTLAHFILERSRVQRNSARRSFPSQALNTVGVKFWKLQVLMQLAVDGYRRRRSQGIRHWNVQSIQETNQWSLTLEDGTVQSRGRIQRLVQDEVRDLSLLIAEQQAQREYVLAVHLVEQPDYLGSVGLGKCVDQLLLILIGGAVRGAGARGYIVVAQMENGEIQGGGFLGNRRAKLRASRGQSNLSFRFHQISNTLNFIAVDVRLVGIALEEGTDRIVPRDAIDIDHRGLDPLFVNLSGV